MHNNYFTLRLWLQQLAPMVKGALIDDIKQRGWRELVIALLPEGGRSYVALKVSFVANDSFVCTTKGFVGKGWQGIFTALHGKRIVGMDMHHFDRGFQFVLDNGAVLIFRLHGNAGNVHVFYADGQKELLRWRRKTDIQVEQNQFVAEPVDAIIHFNEAEIPVTISKLVKQCPPMGVGPIKNWLQSHGYETIEVEKKQKLLQKLLSLLEKPNSFLVDEHNQLMFYVLDQINTNGTRFQEIDDALRQVEREAGYISQLHQLRTHLRNMAATKISRLEQLLEGPPKALANRLTHRQRGDILMVNLEKISPAAKRVTLWDFYNERFAEIKLNPLMSPQKNAEVAYLKAKNEHLAQEARKRNEEHRWAQLAIWTERLAQVERQGSIQVLQGFLEEWKGSQTDTEPDEFNHFEAGGYTILVGRNAQNNDALTKSAHKDDLWLHARDAAGSHVVIKRKGMLPPPEWVVEQAAETAAWFSKKRTEGLCPVIVTEKKWVQKPKGAAAGQVRVLRERVVMVKPTNRMANG